jgi:hypothetical protein
MIRFHNLNTKIYVLVAVNCPWAVICITHTCLVDVLVSVLRYITTIFSINT